VRGHCARFPYPPAGGLVNHTMGLASTGSRSPRFVPHPPWPMKTVAISLVSKGSVFIGHGGWGTNLGDLEPVEAKPMVWFTRPPAGG